MAESYSPRMGVRRWTDNGDTFTRDELDQSFANIEARTAIFGNGTLAARPAPAVQGRFYMLDSTEPNAAIRGQVYYDTGAAWIMIKFDLTAILAGYALVNHTHGLTDLPVAAGGESSTTKLVRADDPRLATEWVAGDILWSAATDRPGFALCDGASYDTGAQAALFAKIGYKWGGSGSNFNVPDLRDKFPIGASASKALGNTGGAASKTITAGHLPQHLHPMPHTHDMGQHLHPMPHTHDMGHTHGAGTTGTDSPDHAHYYDTGWSGGHEHNYSYRDANRVVTGGGAATVADSASGVYSTSGGGGHSHAGNTNGASARHQHSFQTPAYAGSTGGTSAANTGNTGSVNPALDVMNPWLALNPFIKL